MDCLSGISEFARTLLSLAFLAFRRPGLLQSDHRRISPVAVVVVVVHAAERAVLNLPAKGALGVQWNSTTVGSPVARP